MIAGSHESAALFPHMYQPAVNAAYLLPGALSEREGCNDVHVVSLV
jgi:hypothetical protein